MSEANRRRDQALTIWQAGVDAVRPTALLPHAIASDSHLMDAIAAARRILIVGCGKAGGAMSAALESALGAHLEKVQGIVNVPADAVRPLRRIELHAARPAGSNHPTAEGVNGAQRMLDLLSGAGADDIGVCLISGGGSALLPAPADGISLADKQLVTKLLHRCGATIHEMNAVRKHLSKIKGGRLAEAFSGRQLFSLIISDVVGDPLDVIASGPTAPDPTTFADALAVLERYDLISQTPATVVTRLQLGAAGQYPETPKTLPANIRNIVLGNNRVALDAAKSAAAHYGYNVLDLGSFIEGETRQVAIAVAGVVRSIQADSLPLSAPACILLGGETTVTLGEGAGKGGRNQEFVLAVLAKLAAPGLKGVTIISGGTDGEDGPTDAAGALADETTLFEIQKRGLNLAHALAAHDGYPLLDSCGALLRTGLTQTNVMDIRVVLIA